MANPTKMPNWAHDWLLDLMGEWDTPLPTGMFDVIAERLGQKAATPEGAQGAVAWVAADDPMFRDDWRQTTPILHRVRDALGLVPLYTNASADAEDIRQLQVLANIRAAVGDSGQMMQDELVAHIAKLAEDAVTWRSIDTHPATTSDASLPILVWEPNLGTHLGWYEPFYAGKGEWPWRAMSLSLLGSHKITHWAYRPAEPIDATRYGKVA